MRVIFITGANGGLGRAIAEAFLQENPVNFLFLGVHAKREHAQILEKNYAGRCECVGLDVTSREDWQKTVSLILKRQERLDVLVNNAGLHADCLLGTMPVGDWERVLKTNLDSVFHGCQAVLPAMISQRQGRIINIASLSALVPPAGQVNYAAAKSGVVALTQSLAKEVARIGITVNAICPGYIETEALAGMGTEEHRALEKAIPMRRFGKPAEVAAVVRFLACDEASYITGSNVKVDGGLI